MQKIKVLTWNIIEIVWFNENLKCAPPNHRIYLHFQSVPTFWQRVEMGGSHNHKSSSRDRDRTPEKTKEKEKEKDSHKKDHRKNKNDDKLEAGGHTRTVTVGLSPGDIFLSEKVKSTKATATVTNTTITSTQSSPSILSVRVLSNVDFISQLKAIWLSTKILIKIRT